MLGVASLLPPPAEFEAAIGATVAEITGARGTWLKRTAWLTLGLVLMCGTAGDTVWASDLSEGGSGQAYPEAPDPVRLPDSVSGLWDPTNQNT